PHAIPASKPADTFRILVLGDSFTQGMSLELGDAFPERLERLLARQRDDDARFEVYNAGLSGWNTVGEQRVLSRQWDDHTAYPFAYPRVQPDLVVLGFCLNDPEPMERARLLRLEDDLQRRHIDAT